ncbi:unnamed protein product [Pleuronectes platessa]|uniref:Uncharacterized protein n=1 Tax=Pleuronectes platessa TaxID=8262 RepID=A0A9N7TZS9_PLEPL|nr:unnamed protein product [Pleuronectes platessa]
MGENHLQGRKEREREQRHGTSVMLSIFCSVLLCFMGLCKGSRLTGWADPDSLPGGACAVVGVTSRPLANQGRGPRGIISQTHNTPGPPTPPSTGRHHDPDLQGQMTVPDAVPESPC